MSAEYYLIWKGDSWNNPSWSVLAKGSLEEVSALRNMSGDLVVDSDFKIVQDDCWLFDWEKKDEGCYARKNMRANLQLDPKDRRY